MRLLKKKVKTPLVSPNGKAEPCICQCQTEGKISIIHLEMNWCYPFFSVLLYSH